MSKLIFLWHFPKPNDSVLSCEFYLFIRAIIEYKEQKMNTKSDLQYNKVNHLSLFSLSAEKEIK